MRRFCTFFLGEYLFGIEVPKVQEVIPYRKMTRVPLAPPVVRGLINLRGDIVSAIDLRRRLELGAGPPDALPMNVVVHAGDGVVSLLVDRISDVVEMRAEDFEPPPETLKGIARDLIKGTYKLSDRLLLELDVDKVATPPTAPGAGGRL